MPRLTFLVPLVLVLLVAPNVPVKGADDEKECRITPEWLGLPKGNTSIWTEKGKIKCLVQTRAKGPDAVKGVKGRMEIWSIDPDSGKAEP